MKTSRIIVFSVAALAAIVLAFLVRGMMAPKATTKAEASPIPVQQAVPTVKVLVATRDLKPGSRLLDTDLTWQDWPQNLLNPNYIVETPPSQAQNQASAQAAPTEKKKEADVNQAVEKVGQIVADASTGGSKAVYIGGVVREAILANEPIIDSKIVRSDKGGFLAVMLEPGQRAIAVPVNVESTAGGFILPGDHVDIIVTVTKPKEGGGNDVLVSPLLANIKVLAIDQQVMAEKDKQTYIGATATLAVLPKEAEILAHAKVAGALSLTLRSYADVGGASTIENRTFSKKIFAPEETKQTIKVYRNGQLSEVPVSQ